MVAGAPPFFANSNQETFEKIKTQDPVFPPKASSRLRSLLEGLLTKDPEHRLGTKGIDEIKQHPWFSKTNWESLFKKEVKSPFVPLVEEEYDISNFDSEFTGSEVNSWEDRKSSVEEAWDLSDFSCEDMEMDVGMDQFDEDSFSSGSFEMKTEEETTHVL